MMVNEEYRGLVYPWGRKSPMGYGEPLEVAPGVWWVRFEMPGGLDHINIWLLEEEGGWTVVDTCMKLDSAKAQWEQLFDGFMQGKPILRVICTHLHPDHIGLAGWLCERFGALSLNWRDLFGKRAKPLGGLGKRHGAGP